MLLNMRIMAYRKLAFSAFSIQLRRLIKFRFRWHKSRHCLSIGKFTASWTTYCDFTKIRQ